MQKKTSVETISMLFILRTLSPWISDENYTGYVEFEMYIVDKQNMLGEAEFLTPLRFKGKGEMLYSYFRQPGLTKQQFIFS